MKVFILCQETILAEGLVCLLEAMDDEVRVVGMAGSGKKGLKQIGDQRPDVVVVGVSLEDLNGVDATRQLLEQRPDTRVLMLLKDPQRDPLNEALEAGALGYITRESSAEELGRALRTVAGGDTYLSSEAAGVLVKQKTSGEDDPVFGLLSPREREVLQLLAEGYGSKEIGFKLDISPKTVDTHRRNLMDKLETDNLPELVKHAIRAGLTNLKTEN